MGAFPAWAPTWQNTTEAASSHSPAEAQWAQPVANHIFTGSESSPAAWTDPADYDSGTDSDTSSSHGLETYTLDDLPPATNENDLLAEVWWAYSRAKGRWRRMTGKPVRRVRRFLRKRSWSFGKGDGKR